jgi:inner membrane protein YidH
VNTRTSPDDDRPQAAAASQRGQGRLSDHLANQRTLLAWGRTGVSIMALGFVVARFGLLIRELGAMHAHTLPSGVASGFGIVLTLFGAALVGLSLLRYLRIGRGIDEGTARSSPELDIIMSVGLVGAGVILVLYLALSA